MPTNGLLSGADDGTLISYGYDLAGNLVNLDGTARTYNAANQMTNDGSNTLTYDNNGNLTAVGSDAYTWDHANRLTQLNSDTYAYNGDGNRITQTVSGTLTRYLLDTQPALAQVIAATTGATTERYLHGPRGIHAADNGTDWRYTMQDGLGSVRGWVNSAASVSGIVNYTPYGVPDAVVYEFGFTGEQTNGNGLLYLRARHYNPNIAIMTALDPYEGDSGRPMSLNGYSYVEGNVLNAVDPSGLTSLHPAIFSGAASNPMQTAQALNGGTCEIYTTADCIRYCERRYFLLYPNRDLSGLLKCYQDCNNLNILENNPRLNGECRIEVGSYNVVFEDLIGDRDVQTSGRHGFIIFTDEKGNEYEYRAGPFPDTSYFSS